MSRQQGVVKVWDVDGRGFGFIEVGEFPNCYDLFFHVSNCQDDYFPEKCDIVTFIEKSGDDGRKKAVSVSSTGFCVDQSHFENRVSRRRFEQADSYHSDDDDSDRHTRHKYDCTNDECCPKDECWSCWNERCERD